jgi:mannosyl-oligosaccharide alpha-1,3-glucosidase
VTKYDVCHDHLIPDFLFITRECRFYRGGYIVPRKERARRCTKSQRRDPYTLVVALDASGMHARGRLYIDDGQTFAFIDGHYIDADILYSAGKLTYSPRHTGLDIFPAFERVIILGWHFLAPGATYSAIHVEREAPLEVTRVPFSVEGDNNALVVRNPLTPVSKAWTVIIKQD